MHCIDCAIAGGETIEQTCAAHVVDPAVFFDVHYISLKHVNAFTAGLRPAVFLQEHP